MTQLWELSATALSAALEKREASSEEIVRAHLARIERHNPAIKAYSTVFGESALAAAKTADTERARGMTRGPLHGVPVSVKENFDIKDEPTTLGIPKWKTRRAARDAAMVTALKTEGAVILGRTNLSQTLLFVESRNPVYGQTANPWKMTHTPGGSSGGEAAAIAAGMSPLGIGTDIGGSIRTPCHFSGVAGLKPTLDRLPALGQRGILAGQESIRSQCGPMARTVADLALLMNALDPMKLSALDPRVPPLRAESREPVPMKGLRIGVYTHDGLLLPSDSVVRAVETAAAVLRDAGAEVIPFTPKGVPEMISLYLATVSADGGETMRAEISPEELDVVLRPLQRIVSVPKAVRLLLANGLARFGESGTASTLRSIGEKSVAEYWRLTDRLRAYRGELLAQMADARVDVLLCPAYATPAFPHTMSKNFSLASSYAMLFNLVQFPAGTVPVSTVRESEAKRLQARDMLERHARKIDEASPGLPLGVQVVARPWAEGTVLSAMEVIERALRGAADFPLTPVTPSGA